MNINMRTDACDPDQVESFLNGEMTTVQEREFTTHLNTCETCRHSLELRAAEPEAWAEAETLLKPCNFGTVDDDDLTISFRYPQQPLQIQSVLDALGPTDDPAMLGRLGGYEISGVVGAGGMGVVLKAIDKSLDRVVAIKVLAPHLAMSGAARKRFAREAKAAAAVLHPNVIAIHSVSNDEKLPFLVMPYVRGTSLQKRLDHEGPLSLNEILRIGSQIASGLAAAHAQGLVHRDIKPANILLEDGIERVTITDFGLARAVDDATITHSGVIAGTPQYMSPEQARGEPVEQRSDLFSLGSVLYSISTGHPPFRAETTYGVMRRISDEEPKSIREINPDIPTWLCSIIAKLMAKRAADRFETAQEVSQLLDGCLAHLQQPTTVPLPEGIPQAPVSLSSFWNNNRRRKSLIGALGGFGAAIVALFVFFATTSPPEIAGNWKDKHSENWGKIKLTKIQDGKYTGNYSAVMSKEYPGVIELSWSRIERQYTGTWSEGEDRFGTISLYLAEKEIVGSFTTDPKSKINGNTPKQMGFVWANAPPDLPPPVAGPNKIYNDYNSKFSTTLPSNQYPALPAAEVEVLQLKRNLALKELELQEARYKAGISSVTEFQDANDKVELLTAQITANPVTIAEVKLAIARRKLEFVTKRHDQSLATTIELEKAKSEVEIAERELRQLKTPAVTPLKLGLVIERTLNNSKENLGNQNLRLADGKLISTPEHLINPERYDDTFRKKVMNWFLSEGPDMSVRYENDHWQINTIDIQLADLSNEKWENPTADDIRSAFQKESKSFQSHSNKKPEHLYRFSTDVKAPLAYALRLPNGIEGVFQIVEFVENPRSMKIRYKLLQRAKNTKEYELTLNCQDIRSGHDALRLDIGKIYDVPKQFSFLQEVEGGISRSEQQNWLDETQVNLMLDYVEKNDWVYYLRNITTAELDNEDWEKLTAKNWDERYATMKWSRKSTTPRNKVDLDVITRNSGFYKRTFSVASNASQTFAFETSSGQCGVFQFQSWNKFGDGRREVSVRYKLLHDPATPQPKTSTTYTPPENPDLQAILTEAKKDTDAKRYAEALSKYVWFHENAVSIRPSMSGVRTSFALSAWAKLAEKYPPALKTLEEHRDKALSSVMDGKNVFESFQEMASINQYLDKDAMTLDAFIALDKKNPKNAKIVFGVSRPVLIQGEEYKLFAKYIEPEEDMLRMTSFFKMQMLTAEKGVSKGHLDDFFKKSFLNEATTLVAILVVNDRKAEAEKIAKSAKEAWDDPAFLAALDKALKGEVPKPWPNPGNPIDKRGRTPNKLDNTTSLRQQLLQQYESKPLPNKIQVEIGATYLEGGDYIKIDEVHGTANTIKPGNIYEIKGTYRLASQDDASLSVYVTEDANDPDAKIFRDVPYLKTQSIAVKRGEGTFTLRHYFWSKGNPHVSFYGGQGGESFASVYFGTGESLLKKGWWDEGKSLKRDPEKAAKLSAEGWKLWTEGKFNESKDLFELATKSDPTNSAAWNGLGWSALNGGDYKSAKQAFNTLLKIEPDHVAALNGLGQMALSEKDYDAAEKYLLAATKKNEPGAVAPWYGLAKLYLAQEKFADAEKWAQKIVDSGDMGAGMELLNDAKAKKRLKVGVPSVIVPPQELVQAWALLNQGNRGEAKKLFDESLKKSPDDASVLNGLGWYHLFGNESKEAKPYFEKAIKVDSRAAGSLNGLARILKQEGKIDEAVKLWEAMLKNSPQGINAGTMALADIYFERKDFKKALPLLEQIAKEQPGDARIKKMLDKATKSKTEKGSTSEGSANDKRKNDPSLTTVFQLKHVNAAEIVENIKPTLKQLDPDATITIGQNTSTNSLVITTTREHFVEIRALLTHLDVKPDAKSEKTNASDSEPKAKTDPLPLKIMLRKDDAGEIGMYIDEKRTSESQLQQLVKEGKINPKEALQIIPEKEFTYGEVVKAMDILKKVGLHKFNLVTNTKNDVTSSDQPNGPEWGKKLFSKTEHDFGDVNKGDKKEFRFQISNLFSEDVHIESVRSSSECVTALLVKKGENNAAENGITLKTYESGELLIKLDSEKMPETKQATLLVKIDKPLVTVALLKVRANVIAGAKTSSSDAKDGIPKIIKMIPEPGSTDIAPDLKEISVTFDRDMEKGMSWTGNAKSFFPPADPASKARWIDARTCVLPVKLEKASYYRVGINSTSFNNFKSVKGEDDQRRDGVPANPSVIYFTTAGASDEIKSHCKQPTIVTLNPANNAKDLVAKLTYIRVVFDMPMGDGTSFIDGGPDRLKRIARPVSWSDDKKTCTLAVKFEPGKKYLIRLNEKESINFQSQWGVPLKPFTYQFETQKASD